MSKSIEDEGQTIKILGVAKFGNLLSQPANTAHTYTCYLLFDPLVGGFIQICPYVILVPYNTFVISLLLSLYKLNHACNQINFLAYHQSIKEIGHEASFPSAGGDFLFFSLHFLALSWLPNTS